MQNIYSSPSEDIVWKCNCNAVGMFGWNFVWPASVLFAFAQANYIYLYIYSKWGHIPIHNAIKHCLVQMERMFEENEIYFPFRLNIFTLQSWFHWLMFRFGALFPFIFCPIQSEKLTWNANCLIWYSVVLQLHLSIRFPIKVRGKSNEQYSSCSWMRKLCFISILSFKSRTSWFWSWGGQPDQFDEIPFECM